MSREVKLTGRREDTDVVLTKEIADKVRANFFFSFALHINFYTKPKLKKKKSYGHTCLEDIDLHQR